MVYSTAPEVQAQVPGIAFSEGGARVFVQRLVMQTKQFQKISSKKKFAFLIFDVLESQARSAFLPDAVILSILGQLTVSVTYRPINCQRVALMEMDTGRSSIFNIHSKDSMNDITNIGKLICASFCPRKKKQISSKE
ncbi:hypothetical protein KIN20_016295 [Parelaphostrongylus tenuis]|uniref:Uncharacterized protein n=1 Tax=Parelaphostrongylus tenuis TaxID=148309 RepID=A0AAD5QQM1_PARTN|nr:hypothetical protein KIN20_016295 [Parelaphostrongylus tenuis]